MIVGQPLTFQPLPGLTGMDYGLPVAAFPTRKDADLVVATILQPKTAEEFEIVAFGEDFLIAVIDRTDSTYYFAPASQCTSPLNA